MNSPGLVNPLLQLFFLCFYQFETAPVCLQILILFAFPTRQMSPLTRTLLNTFSLRLFAMRNGEGKGTTELMSMRFIV